MSDKSTWIGRAWRRFRIWRWVVIGIVLLLVAARLALPMAVQRYVNKQLNQSRDYSGHVGNIHVQLWRGRYQIDDLKILKRSGDVSSPLFSVTRVFLSIQWSELFHGSIVGKVRLEGPKVNFVSGPTVEQSQTGQNESWGPMLESLFPFDINRLEIVGGQIHFKNDYSAPPVDIFLNGMSATATNLTNSREIRSELPSGVIAHGTTIGGGGLDLQLQLNPLKQTPTYQMTAQLTNVDLTALNSFLKAYGKFDVQSGQFALFASVASKDSNYDGYVKVFFNDLDVFAWEKERQKNALQIFWQAIVGTVADVLKNQSKDSLATRIPISGSYNNKSVGVWSAVGTMLRNAFVRALVPKIDEKMTLADTQQKKEKKIEPAEKPPPEKGAQNLTKVPNKR
jgi:hypothetical protein